MKKQPKNTRQTVFLFWGLLLLALRTTHAQDNPPQYEWVIKRTDHLGSALQYMSEGLIYMNGVGYYDKEGKLVLPCKLPAKVFSNGLAAISQNGLWGFMDKTGKLVIPYQFHDVANFSEDMCAVADVNGKWGVIDKTGKLKVPHQYDGDRRGSYYSQGRMDFWNDNLALETQPFNSPYLVWNECEFFGFYGGLMRVKKDRKWGYIDKTGKLVIPLVFDEAENFHKGMASVEKHGIDKKSGVINKKGEFIGNSYWSVYISGYDNHQFLSARHNKYTYEDTSEGIIDTQGNIVIPHKFHIITGYSEGLFVASSSYGKCGYVDISGKWVIPENKDYSSGSFHEGLALASNHQKKYGFIDKTGKLVIPFQFEDAFHFSDGLAKVKMNGKWGFINRKGRVVIDFQFKDRQVKSFQNGLAFAHDPITKQDGYIRIINQASIRYQREIAQELSNSALFAPKDEFETEQIYANRLAKAQEFKQQVLEKYEDLYEADQKKIQRKREMEIITSYKKVSFQIDKISIYNAEKQTFEIVVNNQNYTIQVPLNEAKALKENLIQAKVEAWQRLKNDVQNTEIINLKLIHPTISSVYPIGNQVEMPNLNESISEPITKENPKTTENPDRDNDGVPNAQDACPDKAGEKAQKGCPDTDQDGIYDHEDRCPEVAGVLSKQGCPIDQNQDSDKDGVPDSKDRCPFQKGTITNNGCPEMEKDVTPPTLALPNLPTSSPSKAYLLAGKAEDSNGIKSIRINGKEIPFFPDGRFEQEVELKEGQNTFTVQASDLAGNASEKRVSLAYRFAGKFPMPKRLALLVGNSAYKYTYKLEKPRADAEEMKKALEALNFKVIVLYDGSKEAMRTAIDDFTQELKTGGYDVGLFFYAGHGAQIDLKMKSHNFLIPTDAKLQDDQKAEFECVYAQEILDGMERSGVKVRLLFLDACRDNPYQKVYGKKRVLGSLESGKGSFVSYATDSGRQAWEDGDGKNSHFTAALLKYINQPNRSIGQIMQTVTKEVSEKTKGNQEPGSYNKLTDDFYFLIEE